MRDWNILIVDDDPLTRALLTGWLDHLGARSTAVASIVEADTALDRQEFDALLSDVHLPGNEHLRWVESALKRPGAPAVVLITGNPELESALRAANLAVAGYLVKPLDLDSLRNLCTRLVIEHRHQRELLLLARETATLLATDHTIDAAVRRRFQCLLDNFASASIANPRAAVTSADAGWRATIAEVITVLEKTKHAFRSKELGDLRRRLESSLHRHQAPAQKTLSS